MIEGPVSIPPHQQAAGDDMSVSIAYRFAGSSDVCDVLAGFWNSICELKATTAQDIGSVMLCYPPVSSESSSSMKEKAGKRYAAVAEIINRILALYPDNVNSQDDNVDDEIENNDSLAFEVVHVNPVYERETIYPQDQRKQEVDGHLPPTSWLRSMMDAVGKSEVAQSMSDQQLSIQNYQRRSPLPGVLIQRKSVR
jgi:hypothetical protein